MSKLPLVLLPVLSLLAILVSCEPTVPKAPIMGEAFVGPAKLEIHAEIAPKSPVVATVRYGDKLQVIGQRRHFLKVRNAQDAEGWVDERNLLDGPAIASLKELASNARKYPSQGQATTYDTLNVHTEPNRTSPSYLQIQAGERVDVIGHRVSPRKSPPRKPLVIAPPKPKRVTKEKEKKQVKSKAVPPPPLPPPPKLPADWLELSNRRDPEEPDEPKAAPKAAPPPDAPPDDWTLIRNANGQAGWVLTRRIFMAIPDEVAQYAEGKRITSYFSLGKVGDKDTWLWTTCEPGPQDHEIEGFRIFTWNPRRKRYETTYIQRRILGYYPVLVKGTSFSLPVEKDGKRYREYFEMTGNRVKLEREEPEPGS